MPARDYGKAGAAREARQPLQALGGGRHVFALMLVGARHEDGVEAFVGKERAQALDAVGGG